MDRIRLPWRDPLPSVRELASERLVNPRTVSKAYRELERAGIVHVRPGQDTSVAPEVRLDREERRSLARGVAKRALLEARRNGPGVEDLVTTIRELATEEEVASGTRITDARPDGHVVRRVAFRRASRTARDRRMAVLVSGAAPVYLRRVSLEHGLGYSPSRPT